MPTEAILSRDVAPLDRTRCAGRGRTGRAAGDRAGAVQVAAQQQIQAEPQVQPATSAPANPILQAGAALAAPIALASNALGMSQPQLEQPNLPGYAWPTYAPYPNYGAVTYPRQYSPSAWPYIGPFYPYPQVPLGWRKVTLEWDDGWWFLNFKSN